MDGLQPNQTKVRQLNMVELVTQHWEQIHTLLDSSWIAPDVLEQRIKELLLDIGVPDTSIQIHISGAPDTPLLYLVNNEYLVVCGHSTSIPSQPFVKELENDFDIKLEKIDLGTPTCAGTLLRTKLSSNILDRLAVPSVLLVNLFHPEMYPTSRLTLGVAYLASFLRSQNRAKVKILDCQFGNTIIDVVQTIIQQRPEIVGISVNFGQFDLLSELLQLISNAFDVNEEPIIILGNVLPAMCYKEILDLYPRVVICRKEGEASLSELVKKFKDRDLWRTIPGICYKDPSTGKIIQTVARLLPLEQLSAPALDTVEELFKHDGVMTAEFSRGCQYNVCSFCPRSHKGSVWRSLPVRSMADQWQLFNKVFGHFKKTPHVFLADEEFIGPDQDGAAVSRLNEFFDELSMRGLQLSFDASCRADQIYSPLQKKEWHIERGYLFRRCVQEGLSRLFVGVESGSDGQLQRYNKGHSVEAIVSAIRYLSLLGVKLRFGFIFFDPLMNVHEFCENIDFLGRTDVVMQSQPSLGVEDIFDTVHSSHNATITLRSKGAVYENVSYMVSPLEVLVKSKYLSNLRKNNYTNLLSSATDLTFARVPTSYVTPEIEFVCNVCQNWVNYSFPITYTLKGLQKVSSGDTNHLLHTAIKEHRYLSFLLIRTLAQVYLRIDQETLMKWEETHPTPLIIKQVTEEAISLSSSGNVQKSLVMILTIYEEMLRSLANRVTQASHLMSIEKKNIWNQTYRDWLSTSITNSGTSRMK